MRSTIFLLTLIFITGNLFSQKNDSTTYKNGFTINTEALLVKDLKVSFTHRIFPKNYLDLMFSYNIPWGNDSWKFKDSFTNYGRAQIRVGLKQYMTNKFYLGEMFLYSYGHFNNGEVFMGPYFVKGDGLSYFITRYKNDFELLLKCGWSFRSHSFLQDLYTGIGFRYKFLNDEVYKLWDSSSGQTYQGPPDYPYSRHLSYGVVTFHLGYQIGYCK